MEKPQKESSGLFQSVADRLSRLFRKGSDTEATDPENKQSSPVPGATSSGSVPASDSPSDTAQPSPQEASASVVSQYSSSETEPLRGYRPIPVEPTNRIRRPRSRKSKDLQPLSLSLQSPKQARAIIRQYVLDHISEESLSVETMAVGMKTSRTGLYLIMRELFEMTPANYILNERLLKAQQLLEKGNTTREVSTSCGFSDPKYFSKVFRKHFGVLPSAYRTQANDE